MPERKISENRSKIDLSLHIDHARWCTGKMFSVVVESLRSKDSSLHNIQLYNSELRLGFATLGLSEMIITDCDTPFTGNEFQEYTFRNGMCHIKTAPYHPALNGLAERVTQAFKNSLIKLTGGAPI